MYEEHCTLFKAGQEHQRQQGQLISHYHYDDQQRLHAHAVTQQEHYLYQRQYDYDKAGNLTRLIDTRKGEHHYHYDPLARLTRADHSQGEQERFAHDPAGNLLMQDRPGPDIVAGNRLMIQGDRHYDYDAFGNLIRERRGKGHQLVTEYRYDCQHRLIGLTQPNGQTASYRYDPFGRRISKTIDGKTTEFFWQGEKLIAEHHADRHRSYLYEPDSFRPLALLEGFGPKETKPYHYQLDHLGTPQELTAPDGEIVWSAHYRAYGEITRLDIGKVDNPLRFQGQYFDQESGLHYNRHRYYNPDVGRYLTPDPVKLAGGINAYQYVPNPTGWVDPLGLSTCTGGDGCKSEVRTNDPAKSVIADEGEVVTPKAGGAQRASRYSANWKTANLNENIVKFAGFDPVVTTTNKGKKIYKNPENGIEIVEDLNGGYFRIYDPSLPGSRRYLSLDGVVPNNKVSPSGKQMGRSQGEYNEVTHFNKDTAK